MFFEKIKRLLLYGGLEPSQYRMISREIDEANRRSVVVLSAACLVFFCMRMLGYSTMPHSNRILFSAAVVLFGGLALWNTLVRRPWVIHLSADLFLAFYLGTGILSAVGSGAVRERTTLYLVFVTVGPMLYALNALELTAIILPAECAFLALIHKYQSGFPVYAVNCRNSLFFAVSGLALGVYMANMKISGIYHAHMDAENQKIRDLNRALSESQEQLRAALEDARQANRAKTVFLNTMSHDIRTPMNAILGFAELADAKAEGQIKGYLGKIRTAGNHLLSLINDVLDMSRIESGTVQLHREPVNLETLAEDIGAILHSSVCAGQLRYDARVTLTDRVVETDSLRLRQILLNLLGNAVKFTPAGGFVHLYITQLGQTEEQADLEFRVEDSGIGMSEEFQEHLFEAFSREESAVHGIQGTGLGMSITKSLVDLMGGAITVSSSPGQGTVFTVRFRFPVSREPISKEAPKTVDFSGKRLLLAEDNELNAELASEILKNLGFLVDVVPNGAEAVEAVQSRPRYDGILMDLQMPQMNGFQAAEAIRKLPDSAKAEVPILAMTADAFEETRQKALNAGMDGHVTKPIELPKLIEALQRLL